MLACTTTLSLFATILSLASVHAAQLRWDGSFCAAAECTTTRIAAAEGRSAKPLLGVRAPGRASRL